MKKLRVIVKAVLGNREGQVLLIRRSKSNERRPNQWDYPGGFVDGDEEYKHAVCREIMEETGIKVDPSELQLAFAMTEFSPKTDNTCWLTFIAQVDDPPQITLSDEHTEYCWVEFDDALAMIVYDRQLKALNHIKSCKLWVT